VVGCLQAANTRDRTIKPLTSNQRIFLLILPPLNYDNPVNELSQGVNNKLVLPLSPLIPRAPVTGGAKEVI
jgi:hypothetical protein